MSWRTPTLYEDLAGTRVVSDKPIVVYGGHVCSTFSTLGACNHMVEQMPPIDSLGTYFLTVPMQTVPGRDQNGDFLRVLAAYADTQVRIDGQLVATLNRSETFNTRLTLRVVQRRAERRHR